jgi:hypothetical protein
MLRTFFFACMCMCTYTSSKCFSRVNPFVVFKNARAFGKQTIQILHTKGVEAIHEIRMASSAPLVWSNPKKNATLEQIAANKIGKAFLFAHHKEFFKLDNVTINPLQKTGNVYYHVIPGIDLQSDEVVKSYLAISFAGLAAEHILLDHTPQNSTRPNLGSYYETTYNMLSFYKNKLQVLHKVLLEDGIISGDLFDIYVNCEDIKYE